MPFPFFFQNQLYYKLNFAEGAFYNNHFVVTHTYKSSKWYRKKSSNLPRFALNKNIFFSLLIHYLECALNKNIIF
jgi:hypothetical protein